MQQVLILLGPPGAGKGTQAVRLAQTLGLPHVSTGDLFRYNRNNRTELGLKAEEFMSQGRLVPDALVLDMLFDRVSADDCADGYLLDGFPRTKGQAQALTERLGDNEPRALELVVSDEEVVKRISGRLSCQACGNVQHKIYNPPGTEGKCDKCGGELVRRGDDAPEVVLERLAVYREETAPLADYYKARGDLIRVDGERSPDEVFENLVDALQRPSNSSEGGR